MELSALTAYAEEKYHIPEQHKWADFPGFSVLADPETGKWAALLMRQWDSETGTEIQRADIKCGRQVLEGAARPWLTLPFRMKGQKWVGVRFEDCTEEDKVFALFDQALKDPAGKLETGGMIRRGFTVVLDAPAAETSVSAPVYRDTALPFVGTRPRAAEQEVPDRIRMMRKLYIYGDVSFSQKCSNFLRQGRFMADYEDTLPWKGEFRHYFPTYHDLSVRQLRGYFTWRAQVRRGNYQPVPVSAAYIYIYELLCGIGTASPAESLQRMRAFEEGYLDTGIGDDGMRRSLRRWMWEYAVIHALPPETARSCADPAMLERDESLAALRDPDSHTEEEIFRALCVFGGKKTAQSPVITGDEARGRRLMAAFWRRLTETCRAGGGDLFTDCFGEPVRRVWRPLANTVFQEEPGLPDQVYEAGPCRRYTRRDGIWTEESYEKLFYDKDRFRLLLHGADRVFRRALKTGRYLKARSGDEEAAACAEAVMAAERRAAEEAARPVIRIDLSELAQIRREAMITRDSLLTEEDKAEAPAVSAQAEPEKEPADGPEETAGTEPSPAEAAGGGAVRIEGLDDLHGQILAALLRGQDAGAMIRAHRLMPSVVTDTINEALFDEVGDSVLECEGEEITVVEDYREDILRLLEE